MTQRYIVKLSACLEIVVGAIFVAAPNVLCILLFDAKPENIGRPLARWVGVSLFALGVACLPAKRTEPHRSAGLGLFAFNAGLAAVLAYFGATSFHGLLLWPVVVLHAVIAAMLLPSLLSAREWWHTASIIDEATTKQRK